MWNTLNIKEEPEFSWEASNSPKLIIDEEPYPCSWSSSLTLSSDSEDESTKLTHDKSKKFTNFLITE